MSIKMYRYLISYTYIINDIRDIGYFVYNNSFDHLNQSSFEFIDSYIKESVFKAIGKYPTNVIINSISFIGASTEEEFSK